MNEREGSKLKKISKYYRPFSLKLTCQILKFFSSQSRHHKHLQASLLLNVEVTHDMHWCLNVEVTHDALVS